MGSKNSIQTRDGNLGGKKKLGQSPKARLCYFILRKEKLTMKCWPRDLKIEALKLLRLWSFDRSQDYDLLKIEDLEE